MKQPKYSDAEIWAAWITTRSVLGTAAAVGCSESAAYARLKRMGAKFGPIGRRKGWKPVAKGGESSALRAKRIAGEFANLRLRDFLIDMGPPTVLPTACKNPDACRREIEARQAWWLPVVECHEVELMEGAPPYFEYRIKLRTNQPLSKGDVETIFVLGVPAMHRKRGERAPCDCTAAQEGDDDQ